MQYIDNNQQNNKKTLLLNASDKETNWMEVVYILNCSTELNYTFLSLCYAGDRIYGRVLWSPEQDLKDAYTLVLEKVFICAGKRSKILLLSSPFKNW